MGRMIEFAVKERKIVLFITAMLVLLGIFSYMAIPKLEIPEVDAPGALITTIYPGGSPEYIERTINKKIEEAMSKVEGYEYFFTEAYNNVSIAVIALDVDTDIDKAWVQLKDEINNAKKDFPEGTSEPTINTQLGESAAVLLSLSGENYSYNHLSEYAEEIKSKMEKISGISKIEVLGKVDEEIKVRVNIGKLNQYDVSLEEIYNTIKSQNLEVPSGSIKKDGNKIDVKTPAPYRSLKDIENTIIGISKDTAAVVRLKDVAEIYIDTKEDAEKIKQEGEKAVLLSIYFKKGKNIVPIGKNIRTLLEETRKELPEDLNLKEVSFRPEDVDRAIKDFGMNLIMGMVLVLVVVFIGMGFRNAIVVSLAIPLSILVTFILMIMTGLQLHTLSLTGLIIALGILVDNAIVVSDGIEVMINEGIEKKTAAYRATKNLTTPIFTSTLTTVVAFMPLLFIPGVAGMFFSSLPKTVIYALSASFLVAMFVTPSLLSMVAKKKEKKEKKNIFKKFYIQVLKFGLNRKILMMGLGTLVFITTMTFIGSQIKVVFFPHADKNFIIIDTTMERGGDLRYTERKTEEIERLLMEEKEIINMTTGIGRTLPKIYGTMNFGMENEGFSRIITKFDLSKSERFKTKEELSVFIKEKIDREIIGVTSEVALFENAKPNQGRIQVRVSGKDMEKIHEVAYQIEEELERIPGTIGIKTDAGKVTLKYSVDMDSDVASSMGILNSDLQKQVNIALHGRVASELKGKDDEYDIVVESDIDTKTKLENFKIKSTITGNKIPLKQFAEIGLYSELDKINRYNKKRSILVACDVKPGISAIDVTNTIKNQIAANINTEGVEIEYAGESKELKENFTSVGILAIFVLLLIYLILMVQFRSFSEPLIILATVPLSLIGVVLGLFVFKKPLSLTSVLGITSLIGVVVNNGILLIEYIKEAKLQGNSTYDACLNAVSMRFRAIMISTITTIMGLVPLAFSSSEMFSPMAVALMSGLVVSTVLTMIIIPVLYMSVDHIKSKFRRNKTSIQNY